MTFWTLPPHLISGAPREIPQFISASSQRGNSEIQTINKPDGVSEGNLLVAYIYNVSAGVTITPPSGWNLNHSNGAPVNSNTLHILTKIAGPSEPSQYTFTWGNGGVVGFILAYTKAASIIYGSSAVTNSNPAVAPSISLPSKALVTAAYFAENRTNDIATPPAGMVQRAALVNQGVPNGIPVGAIYEQVLGSGPTGDKALLWATGEPSMRQIQVGIY